MFSHDSVLFRLVAKIRAVFEEDWAGSAGRRFRRTISKLSDINRKHIHLGDRASAAPELAWNAVQGLASEKHAKAASDYSKAENDRIDTALRRRTLRDKVRQERATAGRLEAELRLAKINELQARVQLAKVLSDLGVAVDLDANAEIRAFRATTAHRDMIAGILDIDEQKLLGDSLFDLVVPEISDEVRTGTLTRWIKSKGDAVAQGESVFEVSTELVDTEIPSPIDGTLVEVLVREGWRVRINDTVVARLRPAF